MVDSPFSPLYNGSMPLPLPSPTPSEGSSIGVHEPMEDDNDDVSWGSGEFSDGESEDEGLEGRKDVQSVQVGSHSNKVKGQTRSKVMLYACIKHVVDTGCTGIHYSKYGPA